VTPGVHRTLGTPPATCRALARHPDDRIVGPPVRSMPPCRAHLLRPPHAPLGSRSPPLFIPKHRSSPSRAPIKGTAMLPARARRRRSAMAAAEPSCRSTHLFGRVTVPTPCLGPIEAQSLACCPASRRTSPDAQTQQPPPTPSVGCARCRPYRSQLLPKPSLGELLLPSAPFPGQWRRWTRWIPANRAVPASQGPHCNPLLLPGVFCVN
jgi:hypothetical protein